MEEAGAGEVAKIFGTWPGEFRITGGIGSFCQW
jgi:hypothetical protein